VKNNPQENRLLTSIGLLFIAGGIICNEWVLTAMFSADGVLESSSRITIWSFQVLSIVIGFLIINKRSFGSRPSTRPASRLAVWTLLGVLLVVGTILRLYHLDFQSFWRDEMTAVQVAGSLEQGFDQLRNDFHPPLYYFVLHFWIELFGASEAGLRLSSVIPGVAAIFFLFRLGHYLFGLRAGLIAAGIFTFSLFQIFYAQEARSYTMLVLLSILSTEACVLWLVERRRSQLIYYLVASTALVYIHHFGWFVLAAQNLFMLGKWICEGWDWKQSGRLPPAEQEEHRHLEGLSVGLNNGLLYWAGAQLAIVALYLPWIFIFLQQTLRVQAGFWIEEPGLPELWKTFPVFLSMFGSPPSSPLWPQMLVAFGLLTLVGVVFSLFKGGHFFPLMTSLGERERAEGQKREGMPRFASWSLGLVLVWLLFPVVASWGLSKLSLKIFLYRTVIVSSPALYLLLGALFVRLPGRWPRIMLMAATLAPSLGHLPSYYEVPYRNQWRESVAFVAPLYEPTDGFVFDPRSVWVQFDYYNKKGSYQFIDIWNDDAPRHPRIWLIVRKEHDMSPEIPGKVLGWGYKLQEKKEFQGIDVVLFTRSEEGV